MSARVDKPRKEEAAGSFGGVYGESVRLSFSGLCIWRKQAVCFMGHDDTIVGVRTNCLGDLTALDSGGQQASLPRNAVQIGDNLDQCDRHIVMLLSPSVGHGIEVSDRDGKFR